MRRLSNMVGRDYRPVRTAPAINPTISASGCRLQSAVVVDRSAAEHGGQHPRLWQIVQITDERIAVDHDELGVTPRLKRADILPAERALRLSPTSAQCVRR